MPLVGEGGWDSRAELPDRDRDGRRRYTRPAMTHVFVAPHPDDVALSCGGLIASLRELGQNVTILTVFSGSGAAGDGLTHYQREALGFGSKALWPVTEAFNRAAPRRRLPDGRSPTTPPWQATADRLEATQADADAAAKRFWQRSSWYRRASIHNESLAGQAVIDDVLDPGRGAHRRASSMRAAAGEVMAKRRLEDERVRLLRRGLGRLPRPARRGLPRLRGRRRSCWARRATTTTPPVEILRREIARLEPQTVYLPLGVGNHVDHQLCRDVGVALLAERRRWVMPGPSTAGQRRRSTRTSRTRGGTTSASSTTCPTARSTACPTGRRR